MSYKGGDWAEFGIIDDFDTKKDYGDSYEPKRYHCIAICDDALDQSNILKHETISCRERMFNSM